MTSIVSAGLLDPYMIILTFLVTLLDELFKVQSLNWLGVCNELNGAYAADGYTRIKGIPGVLVTTYAVGELSAMNGVAGAYAEHAGMIHIVGMPARAGMDIQSCAFTQTAAY